MSITSRCKCPKSDMKPPVEPCSPYFESITSRMQERRCDLIGRQKYLSNKITTMERSIPALIAYNMWMSKDQCTDAPYCKIREIMKKFAPYPDQTDRLLQSLKKTVKELNGETTELHEKIIQADVRLEETGMELESLELANKEMHDTLTSLEKEVKSYVNPSLHSIHSQDLICLSKMRQLAEEELCLKNCIKSLEQKETLFKEHMDRLLTSKEYQNACGRRKIGNCLQDLDCKSKRPCPPPKKCAWYKPNDQRSKKKPGEDNNVVGQAQTDPIVIISKPTAKSKQDQGVMSEVFSDKVEKKSSWMPNWWAGNGKPGEGPPPQSEEAAASLKSNHESMPTNNEEATEAENEKSPTAEAFTQALVPEKEAKKVSNDKPPSKPWRTSSCKPCGFDACPPDSSADRRSRKKKLCAGKLTPPCDFSCDKLIKALTKCADPSSVIKALCELPRSGHNQGKSFPPCYEFGSPCEICPSPRPNFSRPSENNCRCNCMGKCARGMSDAECNCSDVLTDLEYQPKGSKYLSESMSEDDFCECCSCGCEDSDVSSCLCN